MKRKFIILVLSFAPFILYGQEISVDSLLSKSDSIRQACSQLGNKEKVKGYEQALELQDSVYNLMADSVKYFSAFEKDAISYKFFTCSDISVFSQGYAIIETRKLPKYLRDHYEAVSVVRLYSQCIEGIEKKIKDAEADNEIAEADKKNYVAIKIKSEIDKANELLDRIDKVDMSTFSDEQSKFYQGLSERLTNILNKYIF